MDRNPPQTLCLLGKPLYEPITSSHSRKDNHERTRPREPRNEGEEVAAWKQIGMGTISLEPPMLQQGTGETLCLTKQISQLCSTRIRSKEPSLVKPGFALVHLQMVAGWPLHPMHLTFPAMTLWQEAHSPLDTALIPRSWSSCVRSPNMLSNVLLWLGSTDGGPPTCSVPAKNSKKRRNGTVGITLSPCLFFLSPHSPLLGC